MCGDGILVASAEGETGADCPEGQEMQRKPDKEETVFVDRWEDDLAISRMIDEGNPQNSELEFALPRWVEKVDEETLLEDSGIFEPVEEVLERVW